MEGEKIPVREFLEHTKRLIVERYTTMEDAIKATVTLGPIMAGLDKIVEMETPSGGEVEVLKHEVNLNRVVVALKMYATYPKYLTFSATIDGDDVMFKIEFEEPSSAVAEKNSDDADSFMKYYNSRKRERVAVGPFDFDIEYGTYVYEDGGLLRVKYLINVETRRPVYRPYASDAIPLAFCIADYLLSLR